ncbi:Dynamin-like GTPase that mediates homotypic ER fusion [Coemansia aciculifera]|nr:Dynamin-like GTPase that mediates homotypic ER fusion [Coemansia aciculifera]
MAAAGMMRRSDSNGKEASSATRLQLIDEEQQFSDQLTGFMQNKWGMYEAGFDYDVVAVFGSQSTGKSTLLNRLFGTRFDVMSEAQRQQTTRGIWADRATSENSVLILDVEGTDGRERGEQQDFERKSALFSLAVGEVVIVNLWENMVGLYNGANLGLLKTVMEVNLQLFGGGGGGGGGEGQQASAKSKTLLFFVIRDHVSPAPLESLARTLRADLARIWEGLGKPAGAPPAFDAYFDVRFASLPHKLLQPEAFEAGARELRRAFRDRGAADYVFRSEYRRRVPADGFPAYAQGVWAAVAHNKDLDLPTQQELLAQFRCDEIAAAALEPFRAALAPLRQGAQDGLVADGLGGAAQAMRAAALGDFDAQARRYHGGVYAKRRAALAAALDAELHAVLVAHVRNAAAAACAAFGRDCARAIGEASARADYAFAAVVGGVRAAVEAAYARAVDGLAFAGAPWSFGAEARQLAAALDAQTGELRAREVARVVARLADDTRAAMADVVAERLGGGAADMWRHVLAAFDGEAEACDARLARALEAAGVEAGGGEPAAAARRMHAALWDGVAGLLRDESADAAVLQRLRAAVEDAFRYDAHGLPRVWTPADDIDAHFAAARDAARALLPRLARVDAGASRVLHAEGFFPAGYDVARTLVLVAAGRQRDLAKRFAREADALFMEAKRSVVATHGRVPPWVLVLLVLLGWNEAMAVLFNPVYLVLVCLVGGAAFVVHSLGLWAPLLRAANGVSGIAGDHVHRLLVEAVNRTEPPVASNPPLRRRSSRTKAKEEIEMEPIGGSRSGSGSGSAAGSGSESPSLQQ